MDATLVDMGYRGEDASRTRAVERRQPPWQPSAGAGPEDSGPWDDGSRGHRQDDEYAAGRGYGGYASGDSYPGYGEYGEDAGYGQPADHGQQHGYGATGGHGTQNGYGYPDSDGYQDGHGYPPDAGYAHGDSYRQDAGYQHDDGYRADGYQNRGYGQQDGYGAGAGGYPDAGFGGTQGTRYEQGGAGTSGYDAGYGDGYSGGYGQSGGYPAQSGGYGQSGSYPAQGVTGNYPAQHGGYGQSGGYPAQDTDADARNDWYGGHPAAASGSGFADTGTYTLNAHIIDAYGTGPRPAQHSADGYDQDGYDQDGYGYGAGHQAGPSSQVALRDPVRGFPPVRGQLPAPAEPSGPQGLVHTGQQERYDDQYEPYPGYGDQDGYGPAVGYQAPQGYDDYAGPDEYGAGGYGDYPDDDPYQDRFGDDGTAPRPGGKTGKTGKAGKNGKQRKPARDRPGGARGKRPLLLGALAVVVVGVLGAAGYTFLLKPKPAATSTASTGPLPTPGSTSAVTAACVKQFGPYCHIEARTDDPAPLTVDELFPPQFLNETDHNSFARVGTRLDKKCATAVIGPDLVSALQAGKCTQVLRASYVSGDNKIMGTIGVVNLGTTNEAHHAGKVVGANDFVAPLSTKTGISSKLGKGTGVVEAEFKGHYLILTWAEFTTTKAPTTKAQDQQLENFENDLVAGTANISLSQRMISGNPAAAATAAS